MATVWSERWPHGHSGSPAWPVVEVVYNTRCLPGEEKQFCLMSIAKFTSQLSTNVHYRGAAFSRFAARNRPTRCSTVEPATLCKVDFVERTFSIEFVRQV